MGAWGTGINENDTYEDLLIEFMDLYHDYNELTEIPALLNDKHENIADDIDEYSSYWFAMAMGQWKCGGLQPEVLEKVQEIYNTNKGLDLWREENTGDKRSFEKHRKSIGKFLEKIKIPSDKPIKRKQVVPRPCYFKSGDCLAIKLNNGLYGAAYIITHNNDPKEGQNIAAFANYFSDVKPTVNDIVNSSVLKHNYAGWPNRFAIKTFLARSMVKHIGKIELVGSHYLSASAINLLNTKFKHVAFYDLWSWPESNEMLVGQYEFNKTKLIDYEGITISQLISDGCDIYWHRLRSQP